MWSGKSWESDCFLMYAVGLFLPDQCIICRFFYQAHLYSVFTLVWWRTEGAKSNE